MPYVQPNRRTDLELTRHAQTAGELNFLFSIEALDYLDRHGLKYETLNDIVGALELAKQEFIRRIVNEYEDGKIKSNGDLHQFAYYQEHM